MVGLDGATDLQRLRLERFHFTYITFKDLNRIHDQFRIGSRFLRVWCRGISLV